MNKKKRKGIVLLLALLAAILFLPHGELAQAATPKLNKTNTTLAKGKQLQLKVSGTSQKVKWSTSNKKIALVSNRGVVKAKSKGTAKITAKVGKKKLTCKVTVDVPKLEGGIRATVEAGRSIALNLTGTKGKTEWFTSDNSIAIVNQSGVVTGLREGNCRIYVHVSGTSLVCMITVTANTGPNPTINPTIPPRPTVTPTPPTPTPTPAPVPTNRLVYQDENAKIYYQGVRSNFMGYQFDLVIENLTNRTLVVQVRETSINGFMVDPVCSIEIAPGKKAQDDFTILGDDATRVPMNAVGDVETKFHIFDWNDYNFSYDTQSVVIQ